MSDKIPNGTSVRFFRDKSSTEHYAATVTSSHPLGDNVNHYVIDCPDFPYCIGFAHDEELFIDMTAVEALSQEAKQLEKNAKRLALRQKRAAIDDELAALDENPIEAIASAYERVQVMADDYWINTLRLEVKACASQAEFQKLHDKVVLATAIEPGKFRPLPSSLEVSLLIAANSWRMAKAGVRPD